MIKTRDELKAKYFDVISKFGIHMNNDNPIFAKTQRFSIPVSLPGCGRVTAYGDTVEEVCHIALDWLEKNGWKPGTGNQAARAQ
jgi:hypothetical protein